MCHKRRLGFKYTPLAQHVDIVTQAQPYIEFKLHKEVQVQGHHVSEFLQRKVLRRFTSYIVQNKKVNTIYR